MTRRNMTKLGLGARVITGAVLSAAFGCASFGEALNKAVVIEYDQSLNFRGYQFEKVINAPGLGQDEVVPWYGLYADIPANSPLPGKIGFFIVYQICSIKNVGPEAKDFPYDASKFYVTYGGRDWYATGLVPWTYVESGGYDWGTPWANSIISPVFEEEVHTGPWTESISANSSNTLSVSWRIVIYVNLLASEVFGDVDAPLDDDVPLQYEGYPHVMSSRNQPTVPWEGVARSGLPTTCRPPKK